jgi:hypothetical protein
MIRRKRTTYRMLIDAEMQKHCDKCDLRGSGICYWDDERGINSEKSITANLFCQDGTGYERWVGYWKKVR